MDIPDVIRKKASHLKEKELEDYIKKVNTLLEALKPGDRLEILKITKPDTRELFIETVKLFMRGHKWQHGLSFGKGFTELRKYDFDFIMRNDKTKNVTM